MKGVGRIYQQTFVDTYSRVAQAKLYLEKTAITAADMLNDKVIPLFNEQGVDLLRILTDRGTEYCGKIENHSYQLYLAMEDIDHSKTKVNSPQTNGICRARTSPALWGSPQASRQVQSVAPKRKSSCSAWWRSK